MRDNKAFASLSSGLLARKGQARPAMRPQGFGFSHGAADDLGWNDMGHDVPAPRAVTAKLPADLSGPRIVTAMPVEPPVVVRQQDEIAREFAAPVVELVTEVEAPVPAASKTSRKAAAKQAPVAPRGVARRAEGRKAAFTLRLDVERHLKLRLACAVQNRSAQLLVIEALDTLLASLPDVARLAASLPAHD